MENIHEIVMSWDNQKSLLQKGGILYHEAFKSELYVVYLEMIQQGTAAHAEYTNTQQTHAILKLANTH